MVVHEGLRDGAVEASTRALGIRFSGWVDTRRIPRRCRRWARPPSKSLLLPENRIRGVREEQRARPWYGGRIGAGGSGRRRHGGPGRSGTTGCHALHTGDRQDLQPVPTDEVGGWNVHKEDECRSQAAGRAWPGVSSGDGGTVRRAAGSKRVPRKIFSRRETVGRETPEE